MLESLSVFRGLLFPIACFELRRWDVTDWFQQSPVIEPVDPL